jgi:predicted  nucleic acid-binding Zn-ribbon protein
MSFRDELERLVRLQAAELEVRDLQARLDGLPAAREACQGRVRTAEAAVKAAENDRDASQKEHRRLEGELQEAEAQVVKYKEQEMLVKTNQQLWAIQDEMKAVDDRIGRTEEAIIEELEAADTLAAAIGARNEELTSAKTETSAEISDIDDDEKEMAAKLDLGRGEVQELRGETDPELVSLYDRIAAVRGGVAIAEGVDGRCTACNVRLRPQVWVQVRNVSQAQQCDACKRIVFVRDTLSLPSSVSVGDAG